jgi:tetratricopeptide (TPR) repeat protein
LFNPHHVAAFTRLPIEIVSNLDPSMKNDPAFRLQFVSPLDVVFFNRPDLGKSIPGFCYLALLALIGFSFSINAPRIRWAHLLAAVLFVGLSFWNWRLIPFFAIVAVPLAVWNLHAFFAARPARWSETKVPEGHESSAASKGQREATREGWWPGATEPVSAPSANLDSPTLESRTGRAEWTVTPESMLAFLAVMGRLVTVVAGLVAMAAAYPGWLHAKPSVPQLQRRFSWEVVAEPGLKQAAEHLQALTRSGELPTGVRGISLSLDFPNYVAFFAPDVRSFMDFRYTLLGHVSADFMKLRRGLNDLVANVETPEDYASVLRKYDVSYIIVDIEYTSGGGERLLARLLMDPQQWALWYQNGKMAFFGWHDPAGPIYPDPLQLDLIELAFGSKVERLPSAASLGVTREPPPDHRAPKTFLDRYFESPPPPAPPETLAASLYWQLREPAQQRAMQAAQASFANAVAAGWVAQFAVANYYTPFATNFPPAVAAEVVRQIAAEDPLPLAASILAVREARRGALKHPNEGLPYLMLGMAYETLPAISVELRKLQQVSTLHQAIDRLTPEQADGPAGVMVATALQRLYNLHREHGELDLAEEALSQAVRIFDKHPPLGVTEANRDRVKEHLTRLLENLRNDLVAARDRFQNDLDSLRKRNVPLQAQVALAVNYGLIREAVALIEDPAQKLDIPVLQQAVQIYLAIGRVDDALLIIEQVPEQFRANFRELQFNAWVAAGEYALAGQRMSEIVAAMERSDDQTRRAVLAGSAIQQLHFATVDPIALRAMFATVPWGLRIYINIATSLQTDRVARAGFLATRGMLALEEGDIVSARQALRDALAVGVPFPGNDQARIYLKILDRVAGKVN